MNDKIKNSFEESIKVKQKILKEDLLGSISIMGRNISNAMKRGNKLLICGNGGSAADAQHLAAELLIRLKPDHNRQGLPAIAIAMDTSTLTACSNDFGFEKIFERSVQSLGNSGDILLVISTSGKSKNIILAMQEARRKNLKVYGFLGSKGGDAIKLCDQYFLVPDNNTAHIQEAHITAGHALMENIEDNLLLSGDISLT